MLVCTAALLAAATGVTPWQRRPHAHEHPDEATSTSLRDLATSTPLTPAPSKRSKVANRIRASYFMRDGLPFVYHARPHEHVGICMLPKCGSTRWTQVFVRGLVQQGYNVTGPPASPRLPYIVNRQFPTRQRMERYMIVRSPHARLLSGFLGKALTGKVKIAGWDPANGTFASFVRLITSRRPEELDHHFRLQTDQCEMQRGMTYSQACRGK